MKRAIASQVEILAIATSSHKFQCDRPSITFPEFSLDAIVPPIEMGAGEDAIAVLFQLFCFWMVRGEVGDRARD